MPRKIKTLNHFAGFLVAASTAVCACSPAYAYPIGGPFWGPTGLATMPTTDTVPSGGVEVGLGYEHTDLEFGSARVFPVVTGTVGLGRGEIGAGYARERFSDGDFELKSNFWTAHAKYRLFQGSRTALALGGHYLKLDAEAEGHVGSLYAVGSYVLGHNRRHGDILRGHLGIIHHRISSTQENVTRPMLGVDWALPNGVTLAADYLPRQGNVQRAWTVAARYQPDSRWGAQVGFGQFGNGDDRLLASVAYRFGGRK